MVPQVIQVPALPRFCHMAAAKTFTYLLDSRIIKLIIRDQISNFDIRSKRETHLVICDVMSKVFLLSECLFKPLLSHRGLCDGW